MCVCVYVYAFVCVCVCVCPCVPVEVSYESLPPCMCIHIYIHLCSTHSHLPHIQHTSKMYQSQFYTYIYVCTHRGWPKSVPVPIIYIYVYQSQSYVHVCVYIYIYMCTQVCICICMYITSKNVDLYRSQLKKISAQDQLEPPEGQARIAARFCDGGKKLKHIS